MFHRFQKIKSFVGIVGPGYGAMISEDHAGMGIYVGRDDFGHFIGTKLGIGCYGNFPEIKYGFRENGFI